MKIEKGALLRGVERAVALAELVKRRNNAAERRSGRQCSSAGKIDLPAAADTSNSNLTLSNEEESSGDEMEFSSDEDNKSPEPPTLHEIMGITVPRSKLVKWFMEPYFNELIPGCFVRVNTGKGEAEAPVYRLCEVLHVDAAYCNPQYEFESKPTYKYLYVVWDDGTPARLEMTMVSDSPPRRVEFDQWVMEVKFNGGHMPTKQELLEKKQAFQKINSFVYSAAVVKQMVEEKRSAGWKPANIALEKVRLRRELELASDSDVIELKRIQSRLQELEAVHKSSRGSLKKALAVEELNKKNLLANLNSFSKKRVSSKSNEDYDPFSRRWTRPRGVYMATSIARAGAGDAVSASVDSAILATEQPLEKAAGEVKSPQSNEGSAGSVVPDLEASRVMAVLNKLRGAGGSKAGYMERKRQVEASVGVRVPEDDGKSHAHSMSVGEYRKCRGLI